MPKRLDLVGMKFGRLTVLEYDSFKKQKNYWKCICDCGEKIIVRENSLKTGNTKSCGCYNKEKIHETHFKNLNGQKFGRLTIVSFNRMQNGKSLWNCVCECGKETIILGKSLTSGSTQSCGCLRNERIHETTFKDLTSKVFGRLKVISFNKNEKERVLWNCICACGKEKVINGDHLKRGLILSCGCLRNEKSRERCGENSPNWQGGISFEPYCQKFNRDLKRRVRFFFNNECVICGKTQKENIRKLSVHHIEYNKMSCCDEKPVHFAALCGSCHSKTNRNRERWESMLHRIIDEIYNGKSYYTKEEYKNLHPKPLLTITNEQDDREE